MMRCSERAVKTFDVLGALAVAVMPATKGDGLISPQKVGVALSIQIASGQAVPQGGVQGRDTELGDLNLLK